MFNLNELFTIVISKDHMIAELHYTDEYLVNRDLDITSEAFHDFLNDNQIVYGIKEEAVELVISGIPLDDFPVAIATGVLPEHGTNAEIIYEINLNPTIEKTEKRDFRDVMQIPSVEKDQKLASVSSPTKGKDGTDVYGNLIPAQPGKPLTIKTGKNVRYEETESAFYATSEGQASVQRNIIHVLPVFEVKDTLSLKEGNLNFIGTIIIKGDVPSGYKVNAGGDVKIFGMVEAASIHAEGSVFISEGLSGLQKGQVVARENIQIGYINQGNVNAGNNLYVENSILHSNCTAGSEIICQKGSIIGGTVSAGDSIQVKHVGNQMSTKTELMLGQSHNEVQLAENLQSQKKEIEDSLAKLKIIGEKLSQTPNIESNPKLLHALKRQRASYDKNTEMLSTINEQLESLSIDAKEKYAKLVITGNVYANTIVSFGKYKRVINTINQHVEFELLNNEIFMRTR
ncbi:DUF342 domain-containing protein [Ornithinibacillus xuwenensis]|uniref:FapA family protein n=1 Tax=Ornithinibacillus xuwenensis TaxID=3144668 RepID=A0ABU9XDU4_9BACI